MPPSKAFNPVEFQATTNRLLAGKDAGQENLRPKMDWQHRRDVIAECVNGRKIEDYKQVLEAHGFRYFSPERLPLWTTGERRTEGEWRGTVVGKGMAFTDTDILASWRGPEDFHLWVEQMAQKLRAARVGIIIP
jgi:hypothetical protein